jgi:hypothetical protein
MGPGSRTALSALAADENLILQRKQNVQRFGANWIRPPGVAKTYQATMDEVAEREEQEILARREQQLLDYAAAQTEAQNRAQAEEGQDDEMMDGARDLDDDVPEAEDSVSEASEEDEDGSDVSEGEGETHIHGQEGDMTFNEDSFIEGSMVAGEVEHMLEMEEAEIAGVLQEERDLDDDIPEAGSYEHTDTDLDDTDTSEDVAAAPSSAGRRSSGRRSSGIRSTRAAQRSSMSNQENSSLLDGSSFLRSSPAAGRGARASIGSTIRDRFNIRSRRRVS